MATTFPTTLQDLDETRGGDSDSLNDPNHATHHALEDDTLEALQAKVGIDDSEVATSLDYLIKNTTAGHDHDGSDSKKVIATNLNPTGLTASQLLRVNSGGTAVESAGVTAAALATLAGVETLTNKTLTTPIIASLYQDAGKTKLMTIPVTASDTLAAIAATQTFTNKTLTTPIIASIYQDAGKTKLMTIPNTASDTLAAIAATQIFTNKRITKRVTTIVSNATPTVNTDNCDVVTITALATAITSMTTNLSGTPTNFQTLIYRILDNGTGRAITWGATFQAMGVALPTTTTASKVLTVGFIYDTVDSKWGCVAVADEA